MDCSNIRKARSNVFLKMDHLAPIVLFVYNRIDHLKQLITSLQLNEEAQYSDLHIYSDGPRDEAEVPEVEEVRCYLKSNTGFEKVEITHRDQNMGLAGNVIDGVSDVLKENETVIVLEDDLVLGGGFLKVMNELLVRYQQVKNIGSISGFVYPISIPQNAPDFFLLPRASSWGWATWSDRWVGVDWGISDFDEFVKSRKQQACFNQGGEDMTPMLMKWKFGINDSWAIRWSYHHFKNDMYGLFPKHNMVLNAGNDGSGTHSPTTEKYFNHLAIIDDFTFPEVPVIDRDLIRKLQWFFRLSVVRRVINKLIFMFESEKR